MVEGEAEVGRPWDPGSLPQTTTAEHPDSRERFGAVKRFSAVKRSVSVKRSGATKRYGAVKRSVAVERV
jgi:hypothetical protein